MGDERIIETIIKIILSENDESYNKIRSFIGFNELDSKTKVLFKSKLLKELANPKHEENIRNRISEILENIRRS